MSSPESRRERLMEEFKKEMFNLAVGRAIGEAALDMYLDQIAVYWLSKLDSEVSLERDSGEEGEGMWMGKKIKEMSRQEIIKAWKHTDDLYRAALSQQN
jgi:hypothetical protein